MNEKSSVEYRPLAEKEISLPKLFVEFLKIGAVSFGGFMALISMVEERFVEKGGYLKNEVLLDGISIASVLPGPVAVNVVAYVGYKLKGLSGALLSMSAVLFPTFVFIVLLSHFYFLYGDIPDVNRVFSGILPAVCGIILSVALNLARKNINDKIQMVICIAAALALLFIGGFWSTFGIMIISALTGVILFREKPEVKGANISGVSFGKIFPAVFNANKFFFLVFLSTIVIIIACPYIMDICSGKQVMLNRKIALTFGGVSVALFGGGYVFIPMLQELIVGQLHWLTAKEFADGIALGQVTPGPIMISAAFIGYKLSGVLGAIIATISMFLPPAIIMIVVSHFVDIIKNSETVKAIFKGLRPAVIGMIFAAVIVIGNTFTLNWITILIGITIFVLAFKYKISVMYLIPLSGLAGWLMF